MNESKFGNSDNNFSGYPRFKGIKIDTGLVVGATRKSNGLWVLIQTEQGTLVEKPMSQVISASNPLWNKIEKVAGLNKRAFIHFNR